MRLWVGDELVIDDFAEHAPAASTGIKALEAGKWYDLRLEYREQSGLASVKLGWSSEHQTGVGVFETIASANLRAGPRTSLYFTNPLGQGQDPWVIQWQESYLSVHAVGNQVWIDRADQLQDIHPSDPASDTYVVWTAPGGTNHSRQIWAPELHYLNGKWYIYVAASDGDNATHRMHVLERDAASPLGAFTYMGELNTSGWAIDGTALEWQGQRYFVWSGWPGTADGQQNLYIAAMSNPWTLSGSRAIISSPNQAWEQHGLLVNEGPEVLIHDGKLFIIYSGSGYWTEDYALGQLAYDGTGSLLSAANWMKSNGPVFKKTSEVVGVGHASFTKSPDGTQDWIVYHSHPFPGGDPDQRVIRIQPFTYQADGAPDFGAPLPPTAGIEYPSGMPDPEAPHLDGDFDASGAVNSLDLTVFSAQFGSSLFPGISADGIVDGADFLLWQRHWGSMAESTAAIAIQSAAHDHLFGLPIQPDTVDSGRAVNYTWAAIDATFEAWTASHFFHARLRGNRAPLERSGVVPADAAQNDPKMTALLRKRGSSPKERYLPIEIVHRQSTFRPLGVDLRQELVGVCETSSTHR